MMFKRLARPALLAAAAAASVTAIPAVASAQSYGSQHGGYISGYGGQTYNYADYCQRDRQGRTGTGALVGAGAGAVIGSQLAARGRRTEGSILGGVLGAVIGSAAGRDSSIRCEDRSASSPYTYLPNTPAYATNQRYSQGQTYSSGPAYTSGPAYGSGYETYSPGHTSSYGYGSRYQSAQSGSSVYYDENGYGPYAEPSRQSDHYSQGYDRSDRGDACRLAESRIRMPDGRTESRYVRTCPDASGRYRIVD
jgi:hypothetical protein